MPFPSALDYRVERLELRLPTKFLLNFRRGGDKPGRVAWPAWFFDGVDFSSTDFTTRFDHFSNTRTPARPQIVTAAGVAAERQDVRLSEVEDVNVIANTRSVRSLVVGAVDFDVRFFTE